MTDPMFSPAPGTDGRVDPQESSPGFEEDLAFVLSTLPWQERSAGKKLLLAAHAAAIQAAKREGVEMCHNELFHNAKSYDGVIMLDTGETAIRYDNLIKDLEEETT